VYQNAAHVTVNLPREEKSVDLELVNALIREDAQTKVSASLLE